MEKKKRFIAEFKEFISRGSVMDLAVGVIVGTAFTAVVTSLVNDVIMPFIGFLSGGVDFSGLKLVLHSAVMDGQGTIIEPEVAIGYGSFIQTVIDFLFKAFVIFLMIKFINRFHRKKEQEIEEEVQSEPEPSEEVLLLREIRDSLKDKE